MKKIIKNVVITLLFLTLSVSTIFLTYLHFFAVEEEELSGEWIAELDMTERAAVTAFGWLQEIEGVSVSLEDMESCMQNLTIQVNLAFDQADRSTGTFQCNVVPESYEACKLAAYEAFAGAFQELLTERLQMAGYTGGIDEETIEELVIETFGMSTESYLTSCGPDLLPSLEDLQTQYDGSGIFEATQDILTRQFETGEGASTRVEYYIRQDAVLVLSEELGSVPAGFSADDYPVIYTLKQPTD